MATCPSTPGARSVGLSAWPGPSRSTTLFPGRRRRRSSPPSSQCLRAAPPSRLRAPIRPGRRRGQARPRAATMAISRTATPATRSPCPTRFHRRHPTHLQATATATATATARPSSRNPNNRTAPHPLPHPRRRHRNRRPRRTRRLHPPLRRFRARRPLVPLVAQPRPMRASLEPPSVAPPRIAHRAEQDVPILEHQRPGRLCLARWATRAVRPRPQTYPPRRGRCNRSRLRRRRRSRRPVAARPPHQPVGASTSCDPVSRSGRSPATSSRRAHPQPRSQSKSTPCGASTSSGSPPATPTC